MKAAGLLLSLFLYLHSAGVISQDKGFGAGLILGEPTGISLKGWLSSTSAFDAGIAWSFVNPNSLQLHADYLHHMYKVIDVSTGKLPLYIGIGGRFKVKNKENNADSRIGFRFPVGAAYLFAHAPVDIFVEVVPVFDLTPKVSLYVIAALGARYFF